MLLFPTNPENMWKRETCESGSKEREREREKEGDSLHFEFSSVEVK